MYCVPVNNCVSSVIPLFFDVFPPDICLVCVYEVCVWGKVGVCLCYVSCLLVCVDCLLGIVCW